MQIGWTGVALALGLAGCGLEEIPRKEAPPTAVAVPLVSASTATYDDPCPVHIAETTVASVEVEGGASVEFTGGGDVDRRRRSVRRMAQLQNQHGFEYGMDMGAGAPTPTYRERGSRGGAMGNNDAMGGNAVGTGHTMAASRTMTAVVDEVEGGARLVLRPRNPDHLEALRERARQWAEQMAGGECVTLWSDAQAASTPESAESPK